MAEMRTVLVTGVGRREGLGFEICRQMGSLGYRVLLSTRSSSKAETLATELRSSGLDVHALTLDLDDRASIAQAAQLIREKWGSLSALINNAAAIGDFGEAPSSADLAKAKAAFDTTLFGTWAVTQAMLPLLRTARAGRVVFVTSGAGSHGDSVYGLTTGNPTGPAYAVAKAALNALTSLLATELKNSGILVNAVCPGLTATFLGAENMGARPVSEGAAAIVWAATLPDGAATGGFFRDGKPLPW